MADKPITANHDGQCQYQHDGDRCPLPGNLSGSTGRGGAFLCLHHSRDGNRKHDRAQDEHFRIFSDPACVREYVENTYRSSLLRAFQSHLEANPAWRRDPAETRTDYVARMRALHRDKGLTHAVKRMPT